MKEDIDSVRIVQKEKQKYKPTETRTLFGKFMGWPTVFLALVVIFKNLTFDIIFIIGLSLTLLGAAWYTFGPRRRGEFLMLVFYILGVSLIFASIF